MVRRRMSAHYTGPLPTVSTGESLEVCRFYLQKLCERLYLAIFQNFSLISPTFSYSFYRENCIPFCVFMPFSRISWQKRPGGNPLRAQAAEMSWEDFSAACIPLLFRPIRGKKVLALLAASLMLQGMRGILFHSRRAAAPSSSPAHF